MTLGEDLKAEVAEIFRKSWTSRDGVVVPDTESLSFANEAVKLDGTVLYADLSQSTALVDTHTPQFAAEIYKTYLRCASRIIRSDGGEVTAYDGDRIMAVFVGKSKNTDAVRAAFKINYACQYIINPAIREQYSTTSFQLRQSVGIDTSKLFVAKTGSRGANDLVWVGRAANYAAKLAGVDVEYPTWITRDVYSQLARASKYDGAGQDVWQARLWTAMNNLSVYRSKAYWPI